MAAYAIEYVKENPGIMLYMLMLLIANISGLLYAQQKVLGLKRSQKVLLLYIIPKTLAVNLLMGVILLDYMPKDRNWMTIYMVTTALCGILTPLVMWYTYEGSLAKVGTVSIVLEGIVAAIGGIISFLLNFLEKREEISSVVQEFRIWDLFYPVLLWSILFLLLRAGRKPIEKIRACRFRHEKTWAAFVIVCSGVGIFQMWTDARANITAGWFVMGVIACAAVLAVLGISFLIWREYRLQVYRENEYLKTRQRLIVLHMDAIQSQTERLKQLQQTLNEQMKEILRLRQEGQAGQRLRNYLEGLREAYESITAGTYCGDWRLDAIFHYYAGILKENGMVPDFHFYHWAGSPDDDLPGKIFLKLLDLAAEESKRADARGQHCILQAGTVTNQQVIYMVFPWSRRQRKALRELKKLLDGQQSTYTVSVQGNQMKIRILRTVPEKEKE